MSMSRYMPTYPYDKIATEEDHPDSCAAWVMYIKICNDPLEDSASFVVPHTGLMKQLFSEDCNYVRRTTAGNFEGKPVKREDGTIDVTNLEEFEITAQQDEDLYQFIEDNKLPVTLMWEQGVRIVGVLEEFLQV